MITVKNIATGECVTVSNTNVKNGQIIGKYQFGTRYFNKYTMLAKVGDTEDGMQPILQLADGWELEKASTPREPKAEPKAEPVVPEQPVVIEPKTEETPKAEPVQPTVAQPTTVAPSMDAAVQAFAALTPLFAGVQKNVTEAVMNELQPMREQVASLCARAPQTVIHVIKVGDVERKAETGEVFHANFDDVCSRIASGVWVYLYGPTGSGKNVMAEQIAKALGLDFHYQAHTLDRFELTGFIDANGNYQPTEFYKAYTEGGLFMLDELDASDENALITLNSAANGYFAFPCGTVKAHENFRCIAAGNTCGRGATDDYTARRVMDASSLGRFVPRFHGYCDEIDLAAANGDESVVTFFKAMREIKRETGAQMILSPRQIKAYVGDRARGIKAAQSLTDLLAAYMTADELNIVQAAVKARPELADNEHAKAFAKVHAIEY